MSETRILVVEDDDRMRSVCQQLCDRSGYRAACAPSAAAALAWLEDHGEVEILLTDVRMPGMNGLELLETVRDRWPSVDVIIMTAFGSIDNAVEAMRLGAADYVTKPFNPDELMLAIERVYKTRRLQARVDELESELRGRYRFDNFIADSAAMQQVIERMVAASRSDVSVLLTGESGTGKDLVARTIHFAGTRAAGPFVPVNCASLPHDLIESELFGHVHGAYTGADRDHPGLIVQAGGGTLMLDEITEMPVPTQAKLLRVLQDMRVRPVGGTTEQEVDVRVLTATNRDLDLALVDGTLREDLYYRVSVLRIHLPPLRQRGEDLVPLLRHFLERGNRDRPPRQQIDRIGPGAVDLLRAHSWPGNVRELENLVERCFAMGVTGTLEPEDVERELQRRSSIQRPRPGATAAAGTHPGTPPAATAPESLNLTELERQAVARALEQSDSKAAAARLLGISRKTLYRKIRDYGL